MNPSSVPISSLHAPAISRPLAIWLSASVALHVVVLVGYAWWDAARVSVIEFPEEPIKAQLVKLGKPRDPKMLPRLQAAPKPPPPKDNAVAVPALNSKEAPAKDEKRDEKMKDALARIREEADRDKQREDALNRIAERVGKPEEEEGQEDGHAEGTAPNATQVNAYLGLLASRVKARYQVPSVITPTLCDRLVAQVMVKMAVDGTVLDTRIHKSSGNDLFDSAVLSAVKQASPLPKAPDNMQQMVKTGFGFNFRCPQ